jgi:hypothetical protein
MKKHNDIFNELQIKYYKNYNDKKLKDFYLSKMYEVAKEISFNYLNKYERKKGIHLNKDELSHDSAMFVIEQYLRKKDFVIEKISAYVYFGMIKVLYSDKEREMREISFEEYYEKHIGDEEEDA